MNEWVELLKRDPAAFNAQRQATPRAERIMLRGANLSGLDLYSVDLDSLDLTAANLSGSRVQGTGLVRCRLEHTNLEGIEVDDNFRPILDQIELLWRDDKSAWNQYKAREQPPLLSFVDLSNTDLKDADFANMNLVGSRFDGSDLRRCNLNQVRCNDGSLLNARLDGVRSLALELERADLSGARFDGAHLRHSKLNQATARAASFAGATLENGMWTKLDGEEASFESAILTEIHFHEARLPRASFRRAKLESCSLSKADLTGCNFDGATLNRPEITLAKNADFAGATVTEPRQFKGAKAPSSP
jgi:uncharacterized protein YjbI with pentapeptide repeats